MKNKCQNLHSGNLHSGNLRSGNKSVPYRMVQVSFRLSLVLSAIIAARPVYAEDYFNPAALERQAVGQSELDLSRFSTGGQLPGRYLVDIFLNGSKVETADITFVDVDGALQPELTPSRLKDMGVKVEAFPALDQLAEDDVVSNLGDYIQAAYSQFDFSRQRLNLSIPQAALTSEVRGYVDPAEWDQGMPAGLLNYSFSGSNAWRENREGSTDNYYLNLRSGLNLGAWRLRNYSTYNRNNDGEENWDNVNTYLQRDVQSLKGQLTLGDSATPGEVFTSVQYRGVQLASDDNMYPDSLKGFAPVVRGIANSNAQVTVRQNGYIIYQTYVPAGDFIINDLYPTASSGDLEVIITEADGTERRSVQPFSAVPIMLRDGRLKYSMTAGEYRSTNIDALTPGFAQGTLIYGLPYDSSIYTGFLLSENYKSQLVGVGHGFGDFGSVSLDITQASTELRDGSEFSGQSYRFQYAKDIKATNTTFTLAGYRFSTRGFYDFREANEIGSNMSNPRQRYNKRSKMQVNLNQSLQEYGNLYVNAYQQNYWGDDRYDRSLSTGYNLSHKGITYGASYTYSQTSISDRNDQSFAFSVQMPLGATLPNSWASYNLNSRKDGNTTQQVGLSGTALADNNLSYNLQQAYGNNGVGASGNVGARYKGAYGEARAGYNYTDDSKQVNYGLQGGIVAHPYGVTFSQTQGETLALVKAPGASGVKVQNNTGVRTDWRGYAVVPYVSTYRKNRVALDTQTLGDDVDIDTNTQVVIPTKGAVVLADFKTRVGSRVLMTLNYQGQPVPFGATATLVQAANELENTGIVGSDGQLYMSGVPENGRLAIQWGEGSNQQCSLNFTLPEASSESSVRLMVTECQ